MIKIHLHSHIIFYSLSDFDIRILTLQVHSRASSSEAWNIVSRVHLTDLSIISIFEYLINEIGKYKTLFQLWFLLVLFLNLMTFSWLINVMI